MRFLDAKEAVAEMRKHGFDIVRCGDCKRSSSYGGRTYCNRYESYMDDNWFCPVGVHVEKNKCYECPIAEQYNLEDDDTPCQNCGEDDD